MATTTRQQPPWRQPPTPKDASIPPLSIYNSLTRSKTLFIPLDPEGKKVTWYCCGPTVYDDAHLGHARNYVTTDVLRRIMRDYFKFELKFVQNVTDVDDKIILRGRQQHLLAMFKEQHSSIESILPTAKAAYEAYLKKNAPRLPQDLAPARYVEAADKAYGEILKGGSLAGNGSAPGDKEAKLKMHLKTLSDASGAIALAEKQDMKPEDLLPKVEDVLLPYLDSLHGSSIDAEDHSIFTKLTKKYENRFNEDMEALNCAEPDVVTRVTEYGPEIVDFVQGVVKNGFGYVTTDGSVYFDIDAFEAAGNNYARLEPWNRNDKDLQADGEGALTQKTSEKKNDADFALWKSSKPGEPAWPSPWGKGRPGWHIECSAMASDVLGKVFDIHSGGIDLAFPHHDNELAQSEAYWVEKKNEKHTHNHQWVNYFMHMGHLSIQGSKMSKSLKNFTTIREALSREEWTARALRVVFLLGGWREGVEITEDFVRASSAWEDKLNNFFLKAKSVAENRQVSSDGAANGVAKAPATDDALLTALSKAQSQAHEALCDSFNTPLVMRIISDLVSEYNSAPKASISDETTIVVATWITQMVKIFGLDADPSAAEIGWSGIDIPEVAKPFVYPASTLRDEVRKRARGGDVTADAVQRAVLQSKSAAATDAGPEARPFADILTNFTQDIEALAASGASAKEYLSLCDQLRDVRLWDRGIYLEDSLEEGEPALVRPLDRDLIRARQEKQQRDSEKQEAKAKRDAEAAKRAEKGRLDPSDMFKTDEFSAWDEDGLPTKDASGEEVAKSKIKKLRKQWDMQKKAHDVWKAEQSAT